MRRLDLATALTPFEVAVLLAVLAKYDRRLDRALAAGDGHGELQIDLRIDGSLAEATIIDWSVDTLLKRVADLQARIERYRSRGNRLMAQFGRVLMRCAGPSSAWLQRMWGRPRLVIDGRAGRTSGWEFAGIAKGANSIELEVISWRRDAEGPPSEAHVSACRAAAEQAVAAREHGLNGDLVAAALQCRRSAQLIARGLEALTDDAGPLVERVALAVDCVGALLTAGDPAEAMRAWAAVESLAAPLTADRQNALTAAVYARLQRQHAQYAATLAARPDQASTDAYDAWLDSVIDDEPGDATAWFARARRLVALGHPEQARRAAAMAAAYDGDARFACWRDADDATLARLAQGDDCAFDRAHLPPDPIDDFRPPAAHPLRCYQPDAGLGLVEDAGTTAGNFDLDTAAIIAELERWRSRWGARVVEADVDWVKVVFDRPPAPLEAFMDRLAEFCIDCFNFGDQPIRDGLALGDGLTLWWD